MEIITAKEARRRSINCKRGKQEMTKQYKDLINDKINEGNHFGFMYCVFHVADDEMIFFKKTFHDQLITKGYQVAYAPGYYNVSITWK